MAPTPLEPSYVNLSLRSILLESATIAEVTKYLRDMESWSNVWYPSQLIRARYQGTVFFKVSIEEPHFSPSSQLLMWADKRKLEVRPLLQSGLMLKAVYSWSSLRKSKSRDNFAIFSQPRPKSKSTKVLKGLYSNLGRAGSYAHSWQLKHWSTLK